ncbi:MAG TPA: hypothetical protein VI423_00875 [Paenisporosarcina sp.]|nr:hypothetical protein [Paenisporosarcina sp.]
MSDKPLSEKETRLKLFALAKRLGCDIELRQIFTRYDNLLKTCTNLEERKQIAVLANVEVHKLFSFRNPLVVSGKEIIPGE